MTQNQKRKYILLPMFIIGVIALITLAILRGFYEINLSTIIVPFWIALFAVAYINNKKNTKDEELKVLIIKNLSIFNSH